MFKLWIGNRYYTKGNLVSEIKRLLYSEGLSSYDDVELLDFYGLPCDTLKELPSNYELIDFSSRKTILICLDNFGVISDPEIIEQWDGENWG